MQLWDYPRTRHMKGKWLATEPQTLWHLIWFSLVHFKFMYFIAWATESEQVMYVLDGFYLRASCYWTEHFFVNLGTLHVKGDWLSNSWIWTQNFFIKRLISWASIWSPKKVFWELCFICNNRIWTKNSCVKRNIWATELCMVNY